MWCDAMPCLNFVSDWHAMVLANKMSHTQTGAKRTPTPFFLLFFQFWCRSFYASTTSARSIRGSFLSCLCVGLLVRGLWRGWWWWYNVFSSSFSQDTRREEKARQMKRREEKRREEKRREEKRRNDSTRHSTRQKTKQDETRQGREREEKRRSGHTRRDETKTLQRKLYLPVFVVVSSDVSFFFFFFFFFFFSSVSGRGCGGGGTGTESSFGFVAFLSFVFLFFFSWTFDSRVDNVNNKGQTYMRETHANTATCFSFCLLWSLVLSCDKLALWQACLVFSCLATEVLDHITRFSRPLKACASRTSVPSADCNHIQFEKRNEDKDTTKHKTRQRKTRRQNTR